MKVARGNAPSEYPPSDSESRSDALAGVRGKLRRRRTQSYGPTEGRRRRRSLEACAKRSREAEAAKERPFFTESNKDLGIAAPRPPPTRAKPASFRERETNPLDSPQIMRSARTRTNQRRARGPTTDFCQVLDESRTMACARGVEGPSLSLKRAKRNPTRPPRAGKSAN